MPSSLKPRENQGEMPRPVPRIERPSGAVAVDSLAWYQVLKCGSANELSSAEMGPQICGELCRPLARCVHRPFARSCTLLNLSIAPPCDALPSLAALR